MSEYKITTHFTVHDKEDTQLQKAFKSRIYIQNSTNDYYNNERKTIKSRHTIASNNQLTIVRSTSGVIATSTHDLKTVLPIIIKMEKLQLSAIKLREKKMNNYLKFSFLFTSFHKNPRGKQKTNEKKF